MTNPTQDTPAQGGALTSKKMRDAMTWLHAQAAAGNTQAQLIARHLAGFHDVTASAPVSEAQGGALKPCPFCGNTDIDPRGWANGNGESGPQCFGIDDNGLAVGCGATAESVAAWNRRASGTPVVVQAEQKPVACICDGGFGLNLSCPVHADPPTEPLLPSAHQMPWVGQREWALAADELIRLRALEAQQGEDTSCEVERALAYADKGVYADAAAPLKVLAYEVRKLRAAIEVTK